MQLSVDISIQASAEKVWQIISNIENTEQTISGIDKVEVLEKPAEGLKGLKWRETRTMFGREATEIMWITDVDPGKSYQTRAESHGMIYESGMRVEPVDGQSSRLTMFFKGRPVTFGARLMGALLGWMAKGATKKALQKDLDDIKHAAEAA